MLAPDQEGRHGYSRELIPHRPRRSPRGPGPGHPRPTEGRCRPWRESATASREASRTSPAWPWSGASRPSPCPGRSRTRSSTSSRPSARTGRVRRARPPAAVRPTGPYAGRAARHVQPMDCATSAQRRKPCRGRLFVCAAAASAWVRDIHRRAAAPGARRRPGRLRARLAPRAPGRPAAARVIAPPTAYSGCSTGSICSASSRPAQRAAFSPPRVYSGTSKRASPPMSGPGLSSSPSPASCSSGPLYTFCGRTAGHRRAARAALEGGRP